MVPNEKELMVNNVDNKKEEVNKIVNIVEIDVAQKDKKKLSFFGYKSKMVILIILTIYFNIALLASGYYSYKNYKEWLILVLIVFLVFNIVIISSIVIISKKHKQRFIVKANEFEDVIENLACPNYELKERITDIEDTHDGNEEDFDYSNIEAETPTSYDKFEDIDLKELCSKFVLFAEKDGFHVDFSSVREFFSAMASKNLIIVDNKKKSYCKRFIDLVSDFLGQTAFYVREGLEWEKPSNLYLRASNGKLLETNFSKGIINAYKNPNSFNFCGIANVSFAAFKKYFNEVFPFVIHPNRTINLQLSTKQGNEKSTICKNTWFILFVNDKLSDIPKELVENCSIVSLIAYEIDPIENDVDFNVSYSQFIRAINKDDDEYISETNWKKFDEFINETNEILSFRISNKYFCELESFSVTYFMCGGSELEAIDHMICCKLLPYLFSLETIYANEIEQMRKSLDEIFGTENMIATKQALSKLKEQKAFLIRGGE